jgi:hypothetical protein
MTVMSRPARMTVFVRTTWDPDAGVWTAGSPDLPGLVTEAATLEELGAKLPGADRGPVRRRPADRNHAAPGVLDTRGRRPRTSVLFCAG